MKKLIFLIAFFTFINSFGQKTVTLWEAKQSNLVSVAANWNSLYHRVYGRNLFLKVKNLQNQKLKIIIKPGETTFLSHNPIYQNQMVVKADTMIISPKATDTLSLYSVCIGHEKQSPGYGNDFTLTAQTDLTLIDIGEFLSRYNYHNTSTAQAAVWTAQRQRPITSIYSTDSLMTYRLASEVARLTNQPMPAHIELREHHIVVLNGNFTYQVAKPVTASLGVYDSTGKLINMVMNKQVLPVGLHTFKFHANEIADKNASFHLKLISDKGEVLYSKVVTEKDNQEEQTFTQRIIYPFTLEKAYKDLSLGVYDTKGNLMAQIFGYRYWPIGTHNVNYELHHNQKDDSIFYIRLVDKNNKVIGQKTIRKKGIYDDRYNEEELAIQLKYPIAVKTEQTKCVIYNEYGDEVAVVFDDKKLNAGPNEVKYKLKHTYGKNAHFILQVLSPTGQILFCKELVQP